MAINIDTSQPLRRPLHLAHLVDEVVKSGSADEASWLECKSDLDLSKHDGRYKVARAVLSFANRMPDAAEKTCGGLAYVIVGAEPGNAAGTTEIDAADLDKGLTPYLGTDGPIWSPTYVDHNSNKVLVLVIEAPKWGDRIHTLRKQGDAPKGTIFVRAQSNSRPADDAEIRMLEDRLLRGQQAPQLNGLQVGYKIDPSKLPAIFVIDPTPDQIDTWIDERRTAIKDWHAKAIASYDKPTSPFGGGFGGNKPQIDASKIEQHLQICRQRLFDATRNALIHAEVSLITFTVTNPSSRILEDVEMTLTINTAYSAFETGEPPSTLKELPEPPEPPAGPLLPKSFFDIPSLTRPGLAPIHMPFFDRNIDIEDGSVTLTIGRLRPEKPVFSSQFHLFLHERPDWGQVKIDWTLSSTSTDGTQKGTITVPIHPEPRVFLRAASGIPD